ncbi:MULTISPECIES: hypothetical protein [unclassified Caballeronia]|uniref:hypothetical protein n=1 Tax=unclassified Caballeronia TaxID=2646786 RepID=UPI00285C721B|nr:MULTISPECIES: hypothetical protein [unclassified Caballeronia]MDR5777006.1 hypothetical protein [Caballeronia sp. LZ002]MDR5852419.1 hypothetical protein [Caballeronia sp. LZ003]
MTTRKSTTARPTRAKSAARPATGVKRGPTKPAAKAKLSASGQGAVKSLEKKQTVAKAEHKPLDLEETATETRPVGARGGRIGRPKTRLEDLQAVPTRCPAHIYTYLKGISPFLYASLTAMFEDMIGRFLTEQPWEHGLHWRKPKTAMTYANGTTGTTGWSQVNIQLTPELKERVTNTAEMCGVSNACLCYTAIFWWVQFIYPPSKMVK